MAGGTWLTQNKVRPGVYINFETEPKPLGTVGDRGIVTMALPLSWGATKEVITIEAGENLKNVLGYDITEPEMLLIREALKRAKTLLLFRLNGGTKASATHGELTVTAKYGGIRGNDISIVVQENIDDETKFDVQTLVDGSEVDIQTVKNVDDLIANNWVTFSGIGDLEGTAGLPLTGGLDGVVVNGDHTDYLEAVEVYEFNTMALVSKDAVLKGLYTSFVKRLRDDEGFKIQVVVENYPIADHEGVISVKNGVILADGTTLNSVLATAWVAGATAGANVNQSLTYQAYDDAVDVDERYTNSQIVNALKNGEFIFTHRQGRAVVEQDINTLTSFTPKHGKVFAKNRVIRVIDSINNDFQRIFESFYIGKVDNNDDGRNLLKGECINYMETLQGINAIQNFDGAQDILVEQGNEIDSVYSEVYVQPVDAIEKIYMKVEVK